MALTIAPSFKAFYQRGYCREKIEQLAAAEHDYSAALQMREGHVQCLYRRGTVREQMANNSSHPQESSHVSPNKQLLLSALVDFDEAISKTTEQNGAVLNGKGLVLEKFNRHAEAIEYFSKAIKCDKNNSVFWHNRGCGLKNLATESSEHDKLNILSLAITDLSTALDLDPQNCEILISRAHVFRV